MIDIEEFLDHHQHFQIFTSVETLIGCRANGPYTVFKFRFPVSDNIGRNTEDDTGFTNSKISLVGNRCVHTKILNPWGAVSVGPASFA
jgi:hypothetical protein